MMLPEGIVIATAFLVLGFDLFIKEKNKSTLGPIAMFGVFLSLLALLSTAKSGSLLGGRFVMDPVAWWFKLVFLISMILTLGLSRDSLDGKTAFSGASLKSSAEYYFLLLLNLSGMFFLISSTDLISLYVSLELATIPLFILAAWKRNSFSTEAGLKYVVLGALSSALLLYGLGMFYGLTGETSLSQIGQNLSLLPKPSLMLILATAFIFAGVGFKLTLVPFHFWAADVYEGSPTPITAYLSVASKAAGLALLFQIFYRVLSFEASSLTPLMAIFAALTMTLGNCVAIVQTNIKRFMAFSSISQAGYLIMGFLGSDSGSRANGVAAMLFYLLVYVVTNLAVFSVIIYYANQTGKEEIKDYRGLAQVSPLVALAMMISLFGLAGIPPLSGFVGKFFLFSVASQAGFHWLVALAAVNSTVSLYYYLRIVRQMYIEPLTPETKAFPLSSALASVLAVTSVASLFLGIFPYFYESIRADTLNWIVMVIKN